MFKHFRAGPLEYLKKKADNLIILYPDKNMEVNKPLFILNLACILTFKLKKNLMWCGSPCRVGKDRTKSTILSFTSVSSDWELQVQDPSNNLECSHQVNK